MPNPRYSPFKNELNQLSAKDLSVLRTVPEGWYIEYKQEIPSTKSIAKSISALANTYGGWLFYGIKEADSGNRTAEEFTGIPVSKVPEAEMLIRQAASSLISPSPYFETCVLYGRYDELGLAEDMAIIVVEVLMSYDAPHVHGDGRIYRRVAEASEPRPETDRHFLDILWQRGDRRRQALEKLLDFKPEISKGEGEASYLELFLLPIPWKEVTPQHYVEFEEFAKLMKSGEPESGGIPFDNIFSTSDGYIARQANENTYEHLSLTWRYNADGVSHITIPFSSCAFTPEKSSIFAFMGGYSYATPFFEECTRRKVDGSCVVDLNLAYALLWGVIRRHEKLVACANLSFPFNMKLRIRGVWRRIPFIDTENYRDFIRQFGIPIVQDTNLFSPSDLGFYNLSAQESGQDADLWTAVKSCLAFGNVCHMMGLPFDNKLFSQENWFLDINSLADKAKKVQQQRMQKHTV